MKFKGQVDIEDLSKLLIQKQSQAGQDLFVIAMTQGKKNGTFLELGGYHPFEISNTYVLEKMFGWDGWSVDLVDNSLDLNTFEERIWNRFYQDVKDSMWPPVGTKFKDLPKYIQLELINIHNYKNYVEPFENVDTGWNSVRPNTTFIQQDALVVNYDSLPKHIDYLQIDIDDAPRQLQILKNLVENKTFSTITFEHEFYRGSQEAIEQRENQRKILTDAGYILVVSDIAHEDKNRSRQLHELHIYEDWWANPNTISLEIINKYLWIDNAQPKYWEQALFD